MERRLFAPSHSHSGARHGRPERRTANPAGKFVPAPDRTNFDRRNTDQATIALSDAATLNQESMPVRLGRWTSSDRTVRFLSSVHRHLLFMIQPRWDLLRPVKL